MLVSTFLAGFGASGFSLIFNLYLLSLGYQADFVGLVASVTTLSTALSGPLVFSLYRRHSSGTLLAGGFALQAVGCAGQALGGNPLGILAFAAVLGLSQGLYWAPLPPFLAENSTEADRSQLFSVNIAIQLIAGIAGYLFGGLVPAVVSGGSASVGTLGYRTTLLVVTAFASLAVLPAIAARSRPAPAIDTSAAPSGARADVGHLRGPSERGTMTAMALSALTMGVATGLAFPFFNVYFVTSHLASTEAVGTIFSVSAVLSTAAALAAPVAQRRFGYVKAIALTRTGAGAGLVGMAVAASLPAAVGAFWLRNVMLQMMSPLIDAFGMSAVVPARRSLQAATTSALWHAGYGLTSLAAGIMIVASGFAPAFGAAAVICIVNALLFWLYFRSWRPAVEP